MPKQQKNALTFYITTTLMPEMKRQGRVFPNGMADIIPMASQRFKSLPAAEKQRYEQMAKQHKEQARKMPNSQMRDNVGNLISDRKDPREVMSQKRKEDRQAIRQEFPVGDALLHEKFYILAFEYMVEVEQNDYSEFMPCEVGLVEWTMSGGILNSYHRMINPGPVPLGYRFKCLEHSEESHKIPLQEIENADGNLRGIWLQLMNFVAMDTRSKFVYCMEHEYAKVEGCLKWLHSHAISGGANVFRIRFLEDLFIELFGRVGKNIAESYVIERLTTSTFDYEPNTSCDWHEINESRYCALAFAKRYTMILLDSLSTVYQFELTPSHVPARNVTASNYVVTGPNQEQLVPDFSRKPAGRGCTLDEDVVQGRFGGRDVRYATSNRSTIDDDDDDYNAYADHDDDISDRGSLRGSQSQPSMSSYARFANRAVNAPSANQLPAPVFNSSGVDAVGHQLSDLALSAGPHTAGALTPPRPLPVAGRGCGSPGRGQPVLVPPGAFSSPGTKESRNPSRPGSVNTGYPQMMPSAVNQFSKPVQFASGGEEDSLSVSSSESMNLPQRMGAYAQQLDNPGAAVQQGQRSYTCPGSLQAVGHGQPNFPSHGPQGDGGIGMTFNGGRGISRVAGNAVGRGVGIRPPPGFGGNARGSALFLD